MLLFLNFFDYLIISLDKENKIQFKYNLTLFTPALKN